MAGRPPLRIGERGKIHRVQIGPGVWVARCRFRDTDGVTRNVERRSPDGCTDQRGARAEDALIGALAARRAPGSGDITQDTKVMDLVGTHIDRIEVEGRAGRTIDTYRFAASKLEKVISGVRVGEATVPRIDAALRSMQTAHGATMARHSKTILTGGLQLAVMAKVLPTNPVRDVDRIKAKRTGKKRKIVLDGDGLRETLAKVRESDFCIEHDLVDPITMLAGTAIRRSELLGGLWPQADLRRRLFEVDGKLVRLKGKGLVREDVTKTDLSERELSMPLFVVVMLKLRRKKDYYGRQPMIFPSTRGTYRDPDNFNADWREARTLLKLPDITSHTFRRSVATLIDDEGLSARIAADQLGHAKPSMTQNEYFARGRTHTVVADLLDRVINSAE